MPADRSSTTRWEEEARFFDSFATERSDSCGGPIEPAVVARYQRPGRLYAKELAIKLLGDVRGKKILDVGCGDGENSLLLARLGASVTGIDVSPKAIDLARTRARLSGVAGSTEFVHGHAESRLASLAEPVGHGVAQARGA